jgi:predicted DNA-binding transcriptional regulator
MMAKANECLLSTRTNGPQSRECSLLYSGTYGPRYSRPRVDGFMLEALLLRIYLWQLEGTPVTVSMLSRSLGVSRATCRRKLATLIEWGFIKREGQTYRIVTWMGEADQRRMLNRITAILNHATTEMALAKLATSVAH